jgi:hypothetical protein
VGVEASGWVRRGNIGGRPELIPHPFRESYVPHRTRTAPHANGQQALIDPGYPAPPTKSRDGNRPLNDIDDGAFCLPAHSQYGPMVTRLRSGRARPRTNPRGRRAGRSRSRERSPGDSVGAPASRCLQPRIVNRGGGPPYETNPMVIYEEMSGRSGCAGELSTCQSSAGVTKRTQWQDITKRSILPDAPAA